MNKWYYLVGGAKVKLGENEFVAEGGEGKIYAKDDKIYKIYTDPQRVLPAQKLQELSLLDHPYIVRPQQILLDKQSMPIGFCMAKVDHSIALPRLFTNAYRQSQQIDDTAIFALLEHMQTTTDFIHQHGCLIVDGNEMNYLVDAAQHQKAYFIDVDSYQTPNYPATAIMASIRDWHSNIFSPLTDWFAFAILSCQLLLGIHPYKGKHKTIKGLQDRMQANVSIFNPDVTLPSVVRDFAVIPTAWQDWYTRLFEYGERLPPPALSGQLPPPTQRQVVIKNTSKLHIEWLQDYPELIRHHHSFNGIQVVLAGKQGFIDKTTYDLPPDAVLLHEPRQLLPLVAYIDDGQLRCLMLSQQLLISSTIAAQTLLVVDNNLFVVQQDKLTAVQVKVVGQKIILAVGKSWAILPHAHQVLEGMLYQNALGTPYVVVPYKHSACLVQSVPELSGYKIISGRYDNGVAMLLGHRNGQYDHVLLRFNTDFSAVKVQILPTQDVLDTVFVCLDSGTIVHIPCDGELHLYHRYQEISSVVQDKMIQTTMQLSRDGNRLLFYRDKQLYWMRMQ